MAAIPEIFDQPNAAFVFLPAGKKFPPVEKGWQLPENGHNYAEACQHAVKGNVALLAGGGYGGLDEDKPDVFQGLELGATTTWETRPGRLGFWLRWADSPAEALPKFGFKADQAQLFLFKEGVPVGEIKLQRSYQAIPPSWKILEDGTHADYKLLNSSPPAEIYLGGLLQELQKIGITFSEKEKPSLEENAAQLDDTKRTRQQKKIDVAAKARQFLIDALTTAGGREGNRNKTGFWLACQLRDLGLNPGKASEILLEYMAALEKTRKSGQAPYTREEALHNVETAYKREAREPPKTQRGESGEPSARVGDQEKGKAEGMHENLLPCDVKELLDTFKKWLYVAEDYNIIGPSVAAIANFCPGEPDIIGVIGPSGSIKTELIRSLGETQNQFVYPISSITEHTLCSGHKESRDLLPQLKGRLLTIKDLTSILSKKEEVRGQIFADFREISDGYIHKEFGNGVVKEYRDLHSSILFASTNAIERYYSMYANLGQRIIFLRPRNDSERARERAFQNRGKQKEMRQELHATMTSFVSSIKVMIETRGLPSTSEEVQKEMGPFYDFLAIARTPIHRDYRTDEIDEIPEPEFPTRICNTISRLCEVHALIFGREEVEQDDKAFGIRVILDNIPTRRWQILRTMPSGWVVTSLIATGADMSTDAAKRVLAELVSLKLVERWARENKPDEMDKRSDSYKIADKWLEIIEELRGVIRGDSTIDSEKSPKRNSSNEEENIVIKNSPLQSPILISGGEAETEEIRFLARFRTEYTTQWPRGGGRYESITYQEGAECIVPLERALQWKGRGVVDLVEVVLPWEPPEETTA